MRQTHTPTFTFLAPPPQPPENFTGRRNSDRLGGAGGGSSTAAGGGGGGGCQRKGGPQRGSAASLPKLLDAHPELRVDAGGVCGGCVPGPRPHLGPHHLPPVPHGEGAVCSRPQGAETQGGPQGVQIAQLVRGEGGGGRHWEEKN